MVYYQIENHPIEAGVCILSLWDDSQFIEEHKTQTNAHKVNILKSLAKLEGGGMQN